MAKPNTLPDEDIRKISAHLQNSFSCDHKNSRPAQEIFGVSSFGEDFGLPVVVSVCNDCGYVKLYDLDTVMLKACGKTSILRAAPEHHRS